MTPPKWILDRMGLTEDQWKINNAKLAPVINVQPPVKSTFVPEFPNMRSPEPSFPIIPITQH